MTYLLRLVACLFLCVSLNSFGALSIRDLDGDWSNGHEGVYDDVLDITWLADANYVKTSGYNSHGRLSWFQANSWASNLTLGGYTDWRLPITLQYDSSCTIARHYCTGSEMGNLSYSTLGNIPGNLQNTGPFINIQTGPRRYLSATEYDPNTAWVFNFESGHQGWNAKQVEYDVWPVHDGDIGASPVPLPAGIYLFLSGLVGLGLMRGRRSK